MKVEVLAILPHARAFEAVGFGLRDPGLAGLEDRRTEVRGCVSALLDFDDGVRQPGIGYLFGRECLRAPPLVAVGSRCEIVRDPCDALTGFGLPNALATFATAFPFRGLRSPAFGKARSDAPPSFRLAPWTYDGGRRT